MTYPIQIEENLVQEFQNNGFVLTPNVFTDDELLRYGEAVDNEIVTRTADDQRSVAEKSTYEQSFIQCMRLWETDEVVRELSCHAGLAGIAAQLLGVDALRLWQDQALYKEPGGRETTPHQDQPFWPIGDAPLVSAWIPFDDVTIQNGAMAYVPGSHRVGKLKVVDITHQTTPYDILKDPALNGQQPVWVDVPRGSVVWHHGFTVHQAAINASKHTRRVFTTVYLADGYKRAKPWPVFPLDRDSVKVGELMQGAGMPLVWPPQDALPQPHKIRGGATGPQA